MTDPETEAMWARVLKAHKPKPKHVPPEWTPNAPKPRRISYYRATGKTLGRPVALCAHGEPKSACRTCKREYCRRYYRSHYVPKPRQNCEHGTLRSKCLACRRAYYSKSRSEARRLRKTLKQD